LYEDEFSLSNTATVSYQWSKKGQQPQVACKQSKRERQTAFGCFNYNTGQITVRFADKGNSKTFKGFLRRVLFEYMNASKIIMVLDNVAYHHAYTIKDWVQSHPKLELYFLPPYSPDLNAVERAWWYMRKKITHNRFVQSLKDRKIAFWKMFSHYQKPNEDLKIICEINY
jgi:transposase